ncbi:hypothetical protein RQP46_001300 [Phenoliferia psychrophenolica]
MDGAFLDGSYILASQQERLRASPRPDTSTPVPSPPTTPALTSPQARSAADARPTTPTQPKTRRARIELAVEERSVEKLRAIAAETGGFLNSELRRAAWPVLLGVDTPVAGRKVEVAEETDDGVTVPVPHKDEGQVRLDVNRSFVNYPRDISSEGKEALRVKLDDLIVSVLRKFPALHYFQGYHDLNMEDQELSLELSERMSLHRLRDYMGTGLEPVLGYLRLVHRILEKEDPHLSELVSMAAALPYFSLSWVLTLMSHDLTSLDVISRLFDFLLGHNPAMISYLGVAIILIKKEELALLDDDDPAILHHTLSKLPAFAPSVTEASLDPTPLSPTREGDDEDLMSTSHPSPSLSASYLTDSVVSLSSSSDAGEDDQRDTDTDSLSALSDSMLSDPDVSGPGLFDPFPPSPPSPPSPPPPTRPRSPPLVSLDALIIRALELSSKYPLVGECGIAADEVLGPKSCVFTWELSAEGRLDDEAAETIQTMSNNVRPFPTLPVETWIDILANHGLGYLDLKRVGCVSHMFKEIIESSPLDTPLFRDQPQATVLLAAGTDVLLHPVLAAGRSFIGTSIEDFEIRGARTYNKIWKIRDLACVEEFATSPPVCAIGLRDFGRPGFIRTTKRSEGVRIIDLLKMIAKRWNETPHRSLVQDLKTELLNEFDGKGWEYAVDHKGEDQAIMDLVIENYHELLMGYGGSRRYWNGWEPVSVNQGGVVILQPQPWTWVRP